MVKNNYILTIHKFTIHQSINLPIHYSLTNKVSRILDLMVFACAIQCTYCSIVLDFFQNAEKLQKQSLSKYTEYSFLRNIYSFFASIICFVFFYQCPISFYFVHVCSSCTLWLIVQILPENKFILSSFIAPKEWKKIIGCVNFHNNGSALTKNFYKAKNWKKWGR